MFVVTFHSSRLGALASFVNTVSQWVSFRRPAFRSAGRILARLRVSVAVVSDVFGYGELYFAWIASTSRN